MTIPIAQERRLLREDEFEAVRPTHYPDILELSEDELSSAIERLRTYQEEARQGRRAPRGKAEGQAARPAAGDTGTSLKGRVFASALKRLKRERNRRRKEEARVGQGEIARRALEMKRAHRVRRHPRAGRTADEGMRATPVGPGYAGPPRHPRGAPGP